MSFGDLPAPLTPLLASMMMSSVSNRPLLRSGASGRIADV
jgi:hypothetical protein